MVSQIIYCPHLNRDIRNLLNAVPNPQIFTGKQTPKGEDGCLQSHQAIVRQAMERNLPAVFVMEDDCLFTEHFNWDQWCRQVEWAAQKNYDVLVGGCVHTYDPRIVGPGLIAVSAFHSAHCIVYLRSGYEKILKTEQPFDVSVGRVGARVLMVYPFVAVQQPCFSGILQHDVDYVPLYRGYEENLGRMLGLRD